MVLGCEIYFFNMWNYLRNSVSLYYFMLWVIYDDVFGGNNEKN